MPKYDTEELTTQLVAHWTWHREGWLRIQGYYDFAGSGVVHLTGGKSCLKAIIVESIPLHSTDYVLSKLLRANSNV